MVVRARDILKLYGSGVGSVERRGGRKKLFEVMVDKLNSSLN